jgi:hypothetical protein
MYNSVAAVEQQQKQQQQKKGCGTPRTTAITRSVLPSFFIP